MNLQFYRLEQWVWQFFQTGWQCILSGQEVILCECGPMHARKGGFSSTQPITSSLTLLVTTVALQKKSVSDVARLVPHCRSGQGPYFLASHAKWGAIHYITFLLCCHTAPNCFCPRLIWILRIQSNTYTWKRFVLMMQYPVIAYFLKAQTRPLTSTSIQVSALLGSFPCAADCEAGATRFTTVALFEALSWYRLVEKLGISRILSSSHTHFEV